MFVTPRSSRGLRVITREHRAANGMRLVAGAVASLAVIMASVNSSSASHAPGQREVVGGATNAAAVASPRTTQAAAVASSPRATQAAALRSVGKTDAKAILLMHKKLVDLLKDLRPKGRSGR